MADEESWMKNVADEEVWIEEKKQLMCSPDLGYDVTSVHLLLDKQKAMEDEMAAHYSHLQSILQVGDDLISARNVSADSIQQHVDEINQHWKSLGDSAKSRKKRLNEAMNFYQFFDDADEVDAWMFDRLYIVSRVDVGKDEAGVQSMLKKHQDVFEELKNYQTVIERLHKQADSLGEQDSDLQDVRKRLGSIDYRYQDLLELAKQRKQALLDALSLYKLFNEADGIETWIDEKKKFLTTIIVADDMEELAIMKHRFKSFENEMNASASKVAAANELSHHLLQDEHPNGEEIVERQNQLNSSWNNFRKLVDQKRTDINLTHDLQNCNIECKEDAVS